MTFTAGTRVSSASPASDLLTTMDPLITAVTGWTKVESLLVSGTMTWNVYKSDAAYNAQGADFHVAIGYTTATPTQLRMTVFEGWDTSTNLATNFAPNTAQIPVAVTFANPNSAAALPSTGTTMAHLLSNTTLTTTGLTYCISVTPDRIIFGQDSDTAGTHNGFGYYLGLYDSFHSAAIDPFPLCAVQLGVAPASTSPTSMTSSPALAGLATREPGQTITLAANFGCASNGSTGSAWTQVISGGNEAITGKPILARSVLWGRSASALRGLLKDMYIGPINVNNMDTITFTLNSVLYTASRIGTVGSQTGCYVLQV